MAVMADKGPFFEAGTPLRLAGTPLTNLSLIRARAARINPGVAVAADILKADNEQWRPYNSRNHASEGENVLFEDGHVEFCEEADCGRELRQHLHAAGRVPAREWPARTTPASNGRVR